MKIAKAQFFSMKLSTRIFSINENTSMKVFQLLKTPNILV